MGDKKLFEAKQNDLKVDKEFFSVEAEEEIINCEGSPCNFAYKDLDKE